MVRGRTLSHIVQRPAVGRSGPLPWQLIRVSHFLFEKRDFISQNNLLHCVFSIKIHYPLNIPASRQYIKPKYATTTVHEEIKTHTMGKFQIVLMSQVKLNKASISLVLSSKDALWVASRPRNPKGNMEYRIASFGRGWCLAALLLVLEGTYQPQCQVGVPDEHIRQFCCILPCKVWVQGRGLGNCDIRNFGLLVNSLPLVEEGRLPLWLRW